MLSRAKPAGAKGLDAAINVPGTPTQVLVYPVWKEIHKIDVQTLAGTWRPEFANISPHRSFGRYKAVSLGVVTAVTSDEGVPKSLSLHGGPVTRDRRRGNLTGLLPNLHSEPLRPMG
ncbi:MAG: hypothetical protein C7B43_17635 [Sulfobacillus benefaciens]|uniref:Uncharacterized protein n=1 Tax=Sulfobacillus benefaciens TaxID=453960 RepID=A0A2T2WS36_9FIRM|nr:MAG: hypothetical protein C7B43_17635 [Sulfobacillus benefaciens]